MTTLALNTYAQCLTGLIVPSLTNRKHFDLAKLQELADNIKARQVDQPIIIRALPGHRMAETFDWHTGSYLCKSAPKPIYEIVAGERRWRACALAGLTHIPVILREYTDAQAIEVQMVENIWRETLTGLEEGEGFEQWLKQPGITTDYIAEKSGKSTRYVQTRLQLLKLQPETKTAIRSGQIEVSQALLLATVHDPKLQLKALEFAKTTPSGGTKPSVRELAVWLRANVMLDLARAPFQITAANLVPLAGSCKSCPKRTGADPDMFSYVDGADICTDPPCYKLKCEAHLAELQHQADKRGMRLIYGPEAKTICYEKSSTLKGYSALSQVRNDLAAPYSGKRLDQLLSPSPAAPIAGAVLIENPFTRELIPAIPTKEAEAALVAKGLVKVMHAAEPKIEADKAKAKRDVEADIAKLEANTAARIQETYEDMLDAAVLQAVKNMPDQDAPHLISADFLRAYVGSELRLSVGRILLEKLELTGATTDTLTDAQFFKFAVLLMAHGEQAAADQLAADISIDRGALKHKATAEIKAKVAAEIAALKPTAKTPSPKSPLAQPCATPVADAEKSKPKTAKPKAQAKPKLSAKDAQLGIADALQGIEAPPADGAVPVSTAATKFTKGQQVKVGTLREGHEIYRDKYSGKPGIVKAIHANSNHEDLYEVTFKGRTGGVADFTSDELEAVEAVAA